MWDIAAEGEVEVWKGVCSGLERIVLEGERSRGSRGVNSKEGEELEEERSGNYFRKLATPL